MDTAFGTVLTTNGDENMEWLPVLISFLISWVVSAIIIHVVTRLFKEEEGIGAAFLAALIGAIIYGLVYFLLGNGLLGAVIGAIGWILALRRLYDIGWLKAIVIAIVVWIVTSIVSWFLPVLF